MPLVLRAFLLELFEVPTDEVALVVGLKYNCCVISISSQVSFIVLTAVVLVWSKVGEPSAKFKLALTNLGAVIGCVKLPESKDN